MKLFLNKNFFVWISVALVTLIIDFATKIYIHTEFYYGQTVKVFSFFSISYQRNTGAAFSILEGQRWPLIALALGISGFIIYMMLTSKKKKENFALALVLGGAIGNLFDRIYYGFVIDFFDVNFGDWHYPTFNVADCAICLGVALYIIVNFKNNKNENSTRQS